mmetsp:Transcript_10904/g.32683  ORF Transcript_10904/g.32683 Transcript_10904/m.32683 type:complete len:564 (+) Transcript_10904:207-1898(+)
MQGSYCLQQPFRCVPAFNHQPFAHRTVRHRCTPPSHETRTRSTSLTAHTLCTHISFSRPSTTCSATAGEAASVLDPSGNLMPEEDGQVLVQDDLDSLLEVLPADIRGLLVDHAQRANLLEVVLDLGRRPEARFQGMLGGEFLRDEEITWEDLQAAEKAVGAFGGDNRAGVQGTLHRISALRNRKGTVVGLTCRVGRAVTGHMALISDLMEEPNGQSILFLGRPGVGKTTVIREMARVLSDQMHKRVVIVDTSNEIGGDGDVPHPAIGGARRMQVPDPSMQHRVMVEAVENHMPEVIIVDEIGTHAEALACRSIAERGVQLVGTAHGQLLENLIKNPTLSDLIGGITSVTLGDEEARSRGTQKSVLERKAPPTFPLVIEMRERAAWVAHWTEDSVDALLHDVDPTVQLRRRQPGKDVSIEQVSYDSIAELGVVGPAAKNAALPHPEAIGVDLDDELLTPSAIAAAAGAAAKEASLLAQTTFGSGALGGLGAFESDPYAWARRLRDIPDKDALQELAVSGRSAKLSNGGSLSRRSAKFTFTQGSGSTRSKRQSRNATGGGKSRRS